MRDEDCYLTSDDLGVCQALCIKIFCSSVGLVLILLRAGYARPQQLHTRVM